MNATHPVIKSELDNITAILKARGFKPPIVERDFSIEVETYDLHNLIDLYYDNDNSFCPLPINFIISSKGACRIRKLISHDIHIVSLNHHDVVDNRIFISKEPNYQGRRAGSTLRPDIVSLVLNENANNSSIKQLFNMSWCAVLLNPLKTETDYWWFILDGTVVHLLKKRFNGYMLILCPEVTAWDTVEGWYRDLVSIDKIGCYNLLHGLKHEECYPWLDKRTQVSD